MLNTLQNTPLWVYAIFLLLCYSGVKALSPTGESKTSLLVTAPILLGWSLYSLNLTLNPQLSVSCWLAAVILVAEVIVHRKKQQIQHQGFCCARHDQTGLRIIQLNALAWENQQRREAAQDDGGQPATER